MRYLKSVYGIFGIIFVVVGVILLLRTLNIATFTIPEQIIKFWPLGIISIGVTLLLNKKVLSVLLAILFTVIAIFFLLDFVLAGASAGAERDVSQQVELQDYERLDMSVGFGAGKLALGATSEAIVKNSAHTNRKQDPSLIIEGEKGVANVALSHNIDGSLFPTHRVSDEWTILVYDNISTDLSLAYGASDADLDLRGLQVDTLTLESGASATIITFDSYPTEAEITSGASELVLRFPKDIDVRVRIDGSLTSTEFIDFEEDRNAYVNPNYRAFDDRITVDIDADAASVRAEFYE